MCFGLSALHLGGGGVMARNSLSLEMPEMPHYELTLDPRWAAFANKDLSAPSPVCTLPTSSLSGLENVFPVFFFQSSKQSEQTCPVCPALPYIRHSKSCVTPFPKLLDALDS